ncbi:MAG: prepilin peptidase [Alphaproteobacteria bacterium]|nr:prepilin peptidase [Alphaproteobacteria bacterium]
MEGIVVWLACALFGAGMVCDLRTRRIPNAVPLALLALFAVHAAAGGGGAPAPGAIWAHLAIGAALLAGGFALYLTGSFGAGDAKLIAVAGAWIGPADLSLFLLGLAACAFALSLFALLPFDRTRRLRRELPFAVAIAPPAVAVMMPRALAHGFQV